MRKTKSGGAFAGFSYVLIATLLWALIPICVKKCIGSVDAYSMCWIRFAIASPILFVYARARGTLNQVRKEHAWLVVLAGFAIGINYVAYIRGIQSTTASAGNVVVQFEAISLVILSYFWLKERVGGMRLVGTLITFAGVFLALWDGKGFAALVKSDYFVGNMLIVGAAPLWAVYGIAQKLLADRGASVSASLAYIFGVATIVTFPAVLLGYHVHWPLHTDIWLWLAILGVLGTALSYVMMGKGFECLDASTAGVVTCMLPVFTIAGAWMFLHESLSTMVGTGAVLVVVGTLITGHAEAVSRRTKPVQMPVFPE